VGSPAPPPVNPSSMSSAWRPSCWSMLGKICLCRCAAPCEFISTPQITVLLRKVRKRIKSFFVIVHPFQKVEISVDIQLTCHGALDRPALFYLICGWRAYIPTRNNWSFSTSAI
jgi:hypothetical protein